MMNKSPLRYRISDWRQLNKCESNCSRDTWITVSTYLNNHKLNGLKISVENKYAGIVFSYVVEPRGDLINKNSDGTVSELTTGQILAELRKWGFYIDFNPVTNLPGNQIQYLMTLNELHFDKIRILSVREAQSCSTTASTKVVAFQSDKCSNWLNSSYSPSKSEFLNALDKGYAINISAISDTCNYSWEWLVNWVGNISDILEDQTGVRE